MSDILIVILIMMVFMGFFAWFTNKYAAFWYKILVNDQFEAINVIMETDEVPPRWQVRWLEGLALRNNQSAFWRGIYRLLYRWYIFRLDSLARRVKTLSMIKPEDKLLYKEAFEEVRAAWQSRADEIHLNG